MMEYLRQRRRWEYWMIALGLSWLVFFWGKVSAQIRYSIPEEVKDGFIVGNIAKDLGLDVSTLVDRRFRIVSGSKDDVFRVNQNNGVLNIHKKIDREEICDSNSPCVVNLKLVVENPLEIHYVRVEIMDVNDHAPNFPDQQQRLQIAESTLPGARFQLQSARDPDVGVNSVRSYILSQNEHFNLEIRDMGDEKEPFLVLQRALNRERKAEHELILTAVDGGNPPSFDFETSKTFQFHVLATDSGTPPLSSNVTVNVFILDQNDNVPVILYPVSSNGSAEGVEEVPRNVNAGHLVTKVRAYDADIGYNGWLLFSLQEVSDHSLFGLDRYTGQIRTLRSFTETDEAQHKLVILVKDNGNVSLSATATVIIKVVEPKEAFAASDVKHAVKDEEDNDVTFYLIITLGSVSVLFVISIIVLIVMQCSKSTDYSSKYLQDTNYDGTLCHSIQYRSGDKRYMLVGPRMSIGSTIVPGSNGNTLVVPDRRRRTSGEDGFREYNLLTSLFMMDHGEQRRRWQYCRIGLRFILLLCFGKYVSAQTRYSVPEEVKEGSVVGNIAKDLGLDVSTLVDRRFRIVSGSKDALFEENMYSLVTKGNLDREVASRYDITIFAADLGQPPLSSFKTLSVEVSDVNDNPPAFPQNPLELYIFENNSPGGSILSVSAYDKDENENALISYQILRDDGSQDGLASFLNANSETGVIRALKSFDFETSKTFQFHVLATDSGTPALSSNVTVNVFILDQNDNVPVILYPVSSNGSAEGVEEVPRNVNAGHLVTKVRAYDADIGYNGWLLFSLQEVSDHSLFGLDRYTGQIRTLRSFTETDEAQHKLVILVKDNGNVSLSATATVIIKVVEPKEAFAASDVKHAVKDEENDDVTFYLIITLGSVSVLFLISIIVLIVMQCSKSTDYSSKYLQDTNYDGTLCHSIQYRSGDKRYMLVGPRMSIGSTIVPGSNGNTLVVPDRRRRTSGEVGALYFK
ncbi:hypothetical protein MHYP_G00175700 [Metynnis hypsauchen]